MGSSTAGPVLIEGAGSSHDRELIENLVRLGMEPDLEDLNLPRYFTGEIRVNFTARFINGRLVHTDSSMPVSRRRMWRDD